MILYQICNQYWKKIHKVILNQFRTGPVLIQTKNFKQGYMNVLLTRIPTITCHGVF